VETVIHCCVQMKKCKIPSSVPNVDASYCNIVKVDTSVMQELSSFVPNERDYSAHADGIGADCYIPSVTNINEVQSPPPLFFSPSFELDDDDIDERNNKIHSIISMLTSDIGCSSVQAVNHKPTADKATETDIILDLDDIDDLLLQELQLDTEPASACSVVPEALISQPSSVPVYNNNRIDVLLPPAVSHFHNVDYHNNTPFTSSCCYCSSGNCSQCLHVFYYYSHTTFSVQFVKKSNGGRFRHKGPKPEALRAKSGGGVLGGAPSPPNRGSGEHCKLPQWGLWQSPGRQELLGHFITEETYTRNVM